MNRKEQDILLYIRSNGYTSQREIAQETGYSLGAINSSLKELVDNAYVDNDIRITDKAQELFKSLSPKNAIILAAGMGGRMVPINRDYPKALLEINGETLIERLINQLTQAGIKDIRIIVGYCKEKFEYLIDKYNVELIVNNQYQLKNNYYSLLLASKYLNNTYIVPADLWFSANPFSKNELYSWYMLSDCRKENSDVAYKKSFSIERVANNGHRMVGLAYLTSDISKKVIDNLKEINLDYHLHNEFWEYALYTKNGFLIDAKAISNNQAIEINTYDDLKNIDNESISLKSDAVDTLNEIFSNSKAKPSEFKALKKGMTNKSFMFNVDHKRYIMRIPGEGTELLVNRRQEANVYHQILKQSICDNVIYINPDNGYKVTEFIEGARVCTKDDYHDLEICMKKLKELHSLKLKVEHQFDIFEQIEFYESLFSSNSAYSDYSKTKENALSLKAYIDSCKKEYALTHIDAIPDNFLIYEENGNEIVKLIDWEYSGMQDPHIDIAMFCIYSLYTKEQVDKLIDIYFDNECDDSTRTKIYCYISICGLLWSNWCEYKSTLGIEFGEYSLKQYRYAKEYYRIASKEIERMSNNEE